MRASVVSIEIARWVLGSVVQASLCWKEFEPRIQEIGMIRFNPRDSVVSMDAAVRGFLDLDFRSSVSLFHLMANRTAEYKKKTLNREELRQAENQ